MPETVITVRGEYVARYDAERAILSASVSLDGADRAPVVESVVAAAEQVTASLRELREADDAPVVAWSSDRIRVWADRPWNESGQQLPLVHHATIGVRAEFRSVDALAAWVEQTIAGEGVTIDELRWDLTEAKRTSVTAEVRSRAVRDAVDKATVIANSIGLGSVRAVAIADPGMLGEGGSAAEPPRPAFARASLMSADAATGPVLSFTPEQIEVSAAVDARFHAG